MWKGTVKDKADRFYDLLTLSSDKVKIDIAKLSKFS